MKEANKNGILWNESQFPVNVFVRFQICNISFGLVDRSEVKCSNLSAHRCIQSSAG